MSWVSSYMFPEPTPEQVQLLMERFGRARWIERSVVTPNPIAIMWSPLGRERMGEIRSILMALAPKFFDSNAAKCGQLASVKHTLRLFWARRELGPIRK